MTESPEELSKITIVDGTIVDFDLLPKDLQINQELESDVNVGLDIKIGLEFDYEPLQKEIEEGKARLRIIKNGNDIRAFTIYTTPKSEDPNNILLVWVSPDDRRKGIAQHMIRDSISRMPNGDVHMDIRGGQSMTKVAEILGFKQNPGRNMTNRFTLHRD